MKADRKRQIEYGDFQTSELLAQAICARLHSMGIQPDTIIEPTCGVGAFVLAAANTFPFAKLLAFEINPDYLHILKQRIAALSAVPAIQVQQADFFATQWSTILQKSQGRLLILGNFPWVTNAVQASLASSNVPRKSNFQKHQGLDAITGKANFDISEWMLLEVCRWLQGRQGDIAMLVKTAVARKILAYAQKQGLAIASSILIKIDAKQAFNVSVDACLLIMRFSEQAVSFNDYWVFESLHDTQGKRIGHRFNLTVADLDRFERYCYLLGKSPQKWRSGIKHDAAAIMELTEYAGVLKNGYGELVDIEKTYLYPLMKGSDVANTKTWRNKYLLVTQRYVGEPTGDIHQYAPKTWQYLQQYAASLGARASSIYLNNPPFSIFGIGDYAFRSWRIAICGLYKQLKFQLIAPHLDKPVMFDDTVYYLAFDSETEAKSVLELLQCVEIQGLLNSLIFWDEKRPIKASILNIVDWSKLHKANAANQQFALGF
jgi:methylase of polypeptide subunit release factors